MAFAGAGRTIAAQAHNDLYVIVRCQKCQHLFTLSITEQRKCFESTKLHLFVFCANKNCHYKHKIWVIRLRQAYFSLDD